MSGWSSVEFFNRETGAFLPGTLGVEAVEIDHGHCVLRMPVEPKVMALNGYLHAGSVVTLADTAAGTGCMASLPKGAHSFTTIELKSNFISTAREGSVTAIATLVHGGGKTQVWDATVTRDLDDKVIAHFRCTQMILYPRTDSEKSQ